MKWWDRMPWSSFSECWALSQLFHSPLSLHKRLFSFSSLSAIKVVSYAYLRLLIFLPAILIPACASSSLVFLMMYSAYKLNKQNWRIPFPIWNQSVVPCLLLTVASWPAYRFLKRQIRWSGIAFQYYPFFILLDYLHWPKSKYFDHLMRRVDSLEKTLMLGGIKGRRRRGRQRMGWLDGITD